MLQESGNTMIATIYTLCPAMAEKYELRVAEVPLIIHSINQLVVGELMQAVLLFQIKDQQCEYSFEGAFACNETNPL